MTVSQYKKNSLIKGNSKALKRPPQEKDFLKTWFTFFKNKGVPAVVQQDQLCVGSAGT